MSAIAPLSEIGAGAERVADERERGDGRAWAPARPAAGRSHVWYAFGRWLETSDLAEDDGFVLA